MGVFTNPIITREMTNTEEIDPGQEESQLEIFQFLKVRQQSYEGPLDLCLDLIRKHKLDIHSISLAEICEPYLKHLEYMEEIDLEIAVEFLDLASTLILLKSKRLLPKEEDLDLSEMDLNPEELLRRKLILYQKFREIAAEFSAMDRLGREFYPRPKNAYLEPDEIEETQWDLSVYQLLRAYKGTLGRKAYVKPHEVSHESKSIEEKVLEILELLEPEKKAIFQEMMKDERHKEEVILAFMGILELAKLKALKIQQVEEFGQIHLLPSDKIKEWIPVFLERGNKLGILHEENTLF